MGEGVEAGEDGASVSSDLLRRSKRKRLPNPKYAEENVGVRRNPVSRLVAAPRRRNVSPESRSLAAMRNEFARCPLSRRMAAIRDQLERDGLTDQVVCRICLQGNDLDNPCACSGSIQYAHWICIQRWLYEHGGTVCELCRQPYKDGYTTVEESMRNARLQEEKFRNHFCNPED